MLSRALLAVVARTQIPTQWLGVLYAIEKDNGLFRLAYIYETRVVGLLPR